MEPPRRSVPTIFRVSSEYCSRNSRLRRESGRTPLMPAPEPGLLGRKGERMSAAVYTKVSYGLISGSGSTRPPGSLRVSSTKRCSSSSALEQAVRTAYTPHSSTRLSVRRLVRVVGFCIGGSVLTAEVASSARSLLGTLLVGLGGGDLVLVEVTVGLRRELERQLVVGVLVVRLDVDVVQGDDARQRRDAADELAELVVAAAQLDLDRQLGVEVLLHLRLRLEQLLGEPGRKAGLRDVDQQARHLGLARQLAQQGAEGALDVLQLLLVDLEVHGLGVLLAEFIAQRLFLGGELLQARALVVPHEEPDPDRGQHQEGERHGAGEYRQRPAARITRVERSQLFQDVLHCCGPAPPRLALRILLLAEREPSSGAEAVTCCAVSVKLEPGPEPLVVSTTSSAGLRSHCEPSMLRMKADTRVEDCAMPLNLSVWPFCETEVRYTPSGRVRTISSNTCTISGRERCSFSMISMRAMNFCLALSRSLISSICLSSFLI